jgi:hypothetical protein
MLLLHELLLVKLLLLLLLKRRLSMHLLLHHSLMPMLHLHVHQLLLLVLMLRLLLDDELLTLKIFQFRLHLSDVQLRELSRIERGLQTGDRLLLVCRRLIHEIGGWRHVE